MPGGQLLINSNILPFIHHLHFIHTRNFQLYPLLGRAGHPIYIIRQRMGTVCFNADILSRQSMVRETIGLSEDGERIYSKTMNDSIVCYAAQGDTPRELWATNVGFGYEHAPSMQVEKEGVMFGSTKEGLIFALEGKTGKVLWKHKIGNSLISTVVPLNGHEVLFTATSGEVGLLRIKN